MTVRTDRGLDWHVSSDAGERARVLLTAFRERYGAAATGVWAAPGRVNLVGEHTDYAGGLALPFALQHTTLVAGTTLDAPGAPRLRAASVQLPDDAVDVALADVGPGTPGGWGAYVAGAAAVLAERLAAGPGPVPSAALLLDSEVPVGAGLSSSAALSCGSATALDALWHTGLLGSDAGRAALAAVGVRAENEVAQAPTGGMDQAAAMRCEPGQALLLDNRDGSVRQVPFAPADDGLALLVLDTRAHHELVDGQYGERRSACERAAEALGVATLREVVHEDLDDLLGRLPDDDLRAVVRHQVTEHRRVEEVVALLDAGRLRDVGPLLDASHASLRDDYRVSCRELDVACAAAVAAGALGARMTGGGFGGSAIALVPAADVEAVARAVHDAFARDDLGRPAFLVAEPSASAHRVA